MENDVENSMLIGRALSAASRRSSAASSFSFAFVFTVDFDFLSAIFIS